MQYDTNSHNDYLSQRDAYSSSESSPRTPSRTPKKKKPASVTLVSAIVACIVTFILGIFISSFALSDSRVENANTKNVELQATIKEKEDEISSLRTQLDEKSESNIVLGEQIQAHLKTIDNLQSNVQNLETDVQNIADSALNGTVNSDVVKTFTSLSLSQQLILLVVLLVIVIFIISITCGIISANTGKKNSAKPKKEKKAKKIEEDADSDVDNDEASASENDDEKSEEEETEAEEDFNDNSLSELGATKEFSFDNAVNEAIDLLYHNNLEDNISSIGGFKFGITNFEEILSDKAKSKSFGNTENGDFVAFMSTKTSVKKLFIIPRYMTLSDSTVALRGTTDLFDISDEGDNVVTHGNVKIKTIDAPAVFAFGANGWSIESKGHITALGTNH